MTASINGTKAIVIPPEYTLITPSESFTDDSYGVVSWHILFSRSRTPSSDLCAGIAVCPPANGHLCGHRHEQAEIYYIIEGYGEMTIDGVKSHVAKGCSVFIPPNAEHGIENTGIENLKWFYVFPTSAFSDVVYRFTQDEKPRF
ncbi:hypothetical protein PENANT_c078G10616 [Penicillium antarcticum]|uniref:Cupin type-2 domain-containing protein n=1 Tax=Penicillium antarcticum TaxID=416450 RepID=A0A1V6PP95_9EURO|nr:uncharacterized protein N7508_007308 [Penicillium antarcticum]KAJ5300065.1 hypothetical protein N7508_007308 [Penicillium antarcticum]OQD78819.1 hypothetical protein PENANT_c078G10616 [Penicillium antarcticum]